MWGSDGGNFSGLIQEYSGKNIGTLDPVLKQMWENQIKAGDIIVLQNMNFENKILKSSVDMGILSRDTYEEMAKKMMTTSLDQNGQTLFLFERPAEVQKAMRQADMVFNTEFLANGDENSFKKYTQLLNTAMSHYADNINSTTRTGAVAIELMDVTKAFLANAANLGFIEKETATLGLSVDSLSKALYGKAEKHTAYADGELTAELLKHIWVMNEQLTSGNISDSTKESLAKIAQAQPNEVNHRFVKTVRSVLEDLNTRGFTKLSSGLTWYNPKSTLKENGHKVELDEVKTTPRQNTRNMSEALENVLSRYSHFTEDINGFNRREYVEDLLKNFNNGQSQQTIFNRVDGDLFSNVGVSNMAPSQGTSPQSIVVPPGERNPAPSAIGAEADKFWTKQKKFLAGALGVGLAYMAFQDRPHPVERDYSNVSQNFYDDQYLGTAFVEFNERNKHYMM